MDLVLKNWLPSESYDAYYAGKTNIVDFYFFGVSGMKTAITLLSAPNDVAKCYADFPSHYHVAEAYHWTQWFKQDEVTPFTANQNLEMLWNMFNNCDICRWIKNP